MSAVLKGVVFSVCVLAAACPNDTPPPPPVAAPKTHTVAEAASEGRLPATLRELWRVPGELWGVTETRAVVWRGGVLTSVDIATGDLSRTADTTAEDAAPDLNKLLPRLNDERERPIRAVRAFVPPGFFVGDDEVLFVRGFEPKNGQRLYTALVALDQDTLSERWVLPIAYRGDLSVCATDLGVVLLSGDEPVRAVAWDGKQLWLRDVGDAREIVDTVACDETSVRALLRSKKKFRLRTFDAASGDSLSSEPADAVALEARPVHPRLEPATESLLSGLQQPVERPSQRGNYVVGTSSNDVVAYVIE